MLTLEKVRVFLRIIRELKGSQSRRSCCVRKSVKFISGGKLEKENKSMKTQLEFLKADNVKLSEIADRSTF